MRNTSKRLLPGFGLTMGFSLLYLSLLVLIPLSAVFLKAATLSWDQFWQTVLNPRVLASFRLTFLTSLGAAAVNAVFGLLVAWVLVRYRFPGRRFLDGLIDIPFALPTAVAGIALTTLYADSGWIGALFAPLGIKLAYTPIGITIALVFIGLPFVVRTVQPVLQELDHSFEEASACLGASRTRTLWKVVLPELLPALLTGFALAFARGLGEYGSVVFISGNMPMKTEIAPLLIMTKLEQFDYAGATAIAAVLLVLSFLLLFVINGLQRRANRVQRQA
ncbi:sulfate ABC transporter permease [Paenibacillus sp. J31TS4]|uniref:sulfate ABC transporter permease subunit CysT n=1 Tax=Paenibacillus sp. J31TS4 TaxID=2807195 RepID=UPI001B2F79D7|nr:sulfate ABC transporter permease subunit CysT [Paenibacillus sp. J31TS4]GIP38824.1 sulfate ABC transporter permease [Paenibacillus sp. J31TS4]